MSRRRLSAGWGSEIIEAWTKGREKRKVIPCGAVLDTTEVLADPHLRERGTVFDIEHPTCGTYLMIGSPLRLSDPPFATSPAPL